jgi:chitin synthase
MSALDLGRANSRMSLAPSQMMGPAAGSEFYNMEMDNINYPSDDVILAEIRSILATADMMQTSKKTVKEDLSRRFNVDMTPKMKYIGYCVESIIGGTL